MPDRRLVLAPLLALALSARALPAQAPSPDPPSRTRVVMLGTGTPVADPDRAGPATVVLVDSTAYLFDSGAGVMRRWAAAIRTGIGQFAVTDLRRLFVTHLHSDHTLGLADLILTSWTLQRRQGEPLQIFGPPGIGRMTTHLLEAYAEDIRVRTGSTVADHAGQAGPRPVVTEILPGVVYRDSLVTVTAFAVRHGDWEHAYGYRIRTPDRDIVISGDAAPPSAIPQQCQGCDILIHEGGFYPRAAETPYRRAFHSSMEDVLEVALASRPKLLVLTHQAPGDNEAGRRFIAAGFQGRVVVAKDLDIY